MEIAGWGVKVILLVRPVQPVVEVATKLPTLPAESLYKATPELVLAVILAKVVVAKVPGLVVKATVTACRV